jgi:hypothetical protein
MRDSARQIFLGVSAMFWVAMLVRDSHKMLEFLEIEGVIIFGILVRDVFDHIMPLLLIIKAMRIVELIPHIFISDRTLLLSV